jgi:hypothetical protein
MEGAATPAASRSAGCRSFVGVISNPPPLLPPAAKTLFIKRVLDSQKFFIGKVWILFFSSHSFAYLRGYKQDMRPYKAAETLVKKPRTHYYVRRYNEVNIYLAPYTI